MRVNKILFNGDFICCDTMRQASTYLIQQTGIKSIQNGYLKMSAVFPQQQVTIILSNFCFILILPAVVGGCSFFRFRAVITFCIFKNLNI